MAVFTPKPRISALKCKNAPIGLDHRQGLQKNFTQEMENAFCVSEYNI